MFGLKESVPVCCHQKDGDKEAPKCPCKSQDSSRCLEATDTKGIAMSEATVIPVLTFESAENMALMPSGEALEAWIGSWSPPQAEDLWREYCVYLI